MNIGLVTPSLFTGGGERWMLTLADFVPGVKWAGCAVVGMAPVSLDAAREMSERMPLYAFQDRAAPNKFGKVPRKEFAERRELLADLCKQCDVIIAWGTPFLGPWLPSGWRGKLVLVSHGCHDEWTRRVFEWSGPFATHFVAVSEAAKLPMGKYAKQAAVIHNGVDLRHVDTKHTRYEARSLWGWNQEQVVIGYLGRLSSEKNCEGVARAVMHLRDKHGSCYLAWFVGNGMNESPIMHECKDILGTAARFDWSRRNVGDVLRAIDVHVNLSPSEGFGLSTVEAWAAGVPTVTTPAGIVPEATRQFGQLAVEVVGINDEQNAEAIYRAMLDTPERNEIVERARNVARTHFSAEQMGQRWGEYLEKITR